MSKHLADTVFTPAADAVNKSCLPFGFCFGKVIGDLLINNLGFKVIYQKDKSSKVFRWPLNNQGKLVDRTYRLLEGSFDGSRVYFLNLYAYGTFYVPSAQFVKCVDPVIVQDLKSLNICNPNQQSEKCLTGISLKLLLKMSKQPQVYG